MTEVRRSLPELRQAAGWAIKSLEREARCADTEWGEADDGTPGGAGMRFIVQVLRDLLAVLPETGDTCLPPVDPFDENRPGHPAEDLRDEIASLSRERNQHLAAWREQDEALQRIVAESSYDITITCSNDVANLVQRERAEYEDIIRRLGSVLPETPEPQEQSNESAECEADLASCSCRAVTKYRRLRDPHCPQHGQFPIVPIGKDETP